MFHLSSFFRFPTPFSFTPSHSAPLPSCPCRSTLHVAILVFPRHRKRKRCAVRVVVVSASERVLAVRLTRMGDIISIPYTRTLLDLSATHMLRDLQLRKIELAHPTFSNWMTSWDEHDVTRLWLFALTWLRFSPAQLLTLRERCCQPRAREST